MARPIKTGLDYFPLDVDIFDDDKLTAVSVRYGIKGEITAVKLLCAIYRNGYFTEWNETLRIKLLRSLPGVTEQLLTQIVNCLVKWHFFDAKLFHSAGILTSRGIQRRYFAAVARNKRKRAHDKLPWLLLDSLDVPCDDDDEPDETPPEELPPVAEPVRNTAENRYRSQMLASPLWLEQMRLRFNLADGDIEKKLDEFWLDCRCLGKKHADTNDAKQHFFHWLLKKQQQSNDAKSNDPAAGRNARASQYAATVARLAAEDDRRAADLRQP